MQDRIKELAVEAGAMVECDTLTVNGKDAHDFIDALSQAVARECAALADNSDFGPVPHHIGDQIRARFGLEGMRMGEFQQEWIVSPQDERLRELAEKYHADCEAFDRTVCTGPIIDGGIIAANAKEGAAINRHALKLHAETLDRAESEGLTRQDMRRAIGRYA